jgi:hypothetical protein
MRVKVREIDNGHASTPQAGLRLYALIEPVLARGEPVILDFEGVKHCSTAFFSASVGILIEADREDRLPELLRYENLAPRCQPALELASDFAVRCRQSPAGAAAVDEFVRQYFARD